MRLLTALTLTLLLALTGCDALPPPGALNPSNSSDQPELPDYQLSFACEACGKAAPQAGPAPLTIRASLSTHEGVKQIYWDFGDGSAPKGLTVHHTYQAPGQYEVKAEIHTESGKIIGPLTRLFVVTKPQFTTNFQTDTERGDLCTIERKLPETIRKGEPFRVRVTITAHQPLFNIYWQDMTWFPAFDVKQVPEQNIVAEIPQGWKQTFIYDVELYRTPDQLNLWMRGRVKCSTGGNAPKTEELTLKSELTISTR